VPFLDELTELRRGRCAYTLRFVARERLEDFDEDRRTRLYSRGLNKTLATPHRKYVMRLAVQQALARYRETLPPGER
jgi:hypothetical protein